MNRREFFKTSFAGAVVACGVLPPWLAQAVQSPEVGSILPKWKPGELELHFIYTGCGENCFYRLPDGTAILNDVGDFYRPSDLNEIPLLPSPDRIGGEWVSRYIQRVYPEKTIDYVIFRIGTLIIQAQAPSIEKRHLALIIAIENILKVLRVMV